MNVTKSVIAAVCGAAMLGVAMPSSLAAAESAGCETTSVQAYTKGGAEPDSFDRSGNVLLRASGGEALGVMRPDGSEVWMYDLESLDGDWAAGWNGGYMTSDGTVLGGAQNFDVTGWDGSWRAFAWKGEGLIWLRRGLNAHALDANASGVIVGYKGYWNIDAGARAVYWPSGTSRPRELRTPARFVESKAIIVDRDGTIYGRAERSDETSVWLMWRDDSMSVVRLPKRFRVWEVSNGQFAGSVTTRTGRERPAFFDEDGLWVPSIPDGTTGAATEVTANGMFGGTLRGEDQLPALVFVGRTASADLSFVPTATDHVWLTELRTFDGGSALTSDGWITSCLNP